MFIVDFDDTLFDTHKYKYARMNALQKLGVSEEIFWKTYKMARSSEEGVATYSDLRHAYMLEGFGFEKEKVLSVFTEINNKMKDFLFEDTIFFLETVKVTGAPLILLSLGESETQEMKVKKSGIDVFFDRMFMVDETKEDVVREVLDHHKPEKVWFINDKVKETQGVLQACLSITPVLRQSPSIPAEEYSESGLPYFQTLTEILHYVEQSK